jgi:hypothetical protein
MIALSDHVDGASVDDKMCTSYQTNENDRFEAFSLRGGAVGSDSQIEFISGSAGVIKLPI